MVEHMQRYPESGMTQKVYCEVHGISKATFGYWLKKHRTEQKKETGGFVQVRPRVSEGQTEIRYTNGVVIRFSGSVTIQLADKSAKHARLRIIIILP